MQESLRREAGSDLIACVWPSAPDFRSSRQRKRQSKGQALPAARGPQTPGFGSPPKIRQQGPRQDCPFCQLMVALTICFSSGCSDHERSAKAEGRVNLCTARVGFKLLHLASERAKEESAGLGECQY